MSSEPALKEYASSASSALSDDTGMPNNARDVEKQQQKGPTATGDAGLGPPPDGGLQAWLAVAGGFCAAFSSFGWINCIGIFQDYYESHQLKDLSSSSIAWIPSLESFMMFFCGPVVGKLTDEFGPRVPILIGTFLHVFGLMMTSLCRKYYQLILAQSLCSAIGCSCLFYAPIGAVGTWFSKNRATAFGSMFAGSSIGGVVLPVMILRLIPKVGFGWTMRITAFMFLGLLVMTNLTVKSRLPPPKRRFDALDFVRPFREVSFCLLTAAAFAIYLGSYLPFNFITLQAKAQGVPTSLADYMIPIVNAASFFGRLIPAWLGDRYGVFNVMIPVTLLSGIFTLSLWLPARATAPLIVYAVLYGFTSGCTLSILPAMVASISDVRQLGARNGAVYAVGSVGALIGSPIAGAIQNNQSGGYSGIITFCGICLLVGSVLTTASRQALTGGELLKRL